jgi:beta-lactamase regulating signal transducer with metallopeptidase domain
VSFFIFETSVEAFRALVVMTLTGAAITAVLLAAKPILKNRLPKAAQYYLWLVALAAFLVPASEFIAIPEQVPSISNAVDWYVVTAQEVGERIESYERPDGDGYIGVPEEYRETVDALVPEPWVTNAVDLARVIWYIGALIFLSVFAFSYYSYAEYVVKKHSRSASQEQISALAELTEKPPRLFLNANAATPMLIGLFRPAIILPDNEYSDEQLRSVLLHELTHLRRHDILVKWLSVLACSLHWFNPLVWLARREIDRACELACDEAVIARLDADGRQSYGDTLIAVAADTKMPRAILSTTMCERKKSLKERLGAIMNHKKATKMTVICSAALVILLAGCAAMLGAGSGEAEERYPEATISREGKSAVLTLGDSEHIPYAELGSTVSLNFGENRPDAVSVVEVIAKADGSRKYADATDKTLEVTYSGGNLVSFDIQKNFGDALSSNSDDYQLGNAFRWYRILCGDGDGAVTEYGLWLRTDPAINLARIGILPDDVDVPDAVLAAAVDWVEGDYEGRRDIGLEGQRELGAEFDNWRIDYIERAYRYDDMNLEVYRFGWRVHTTTPDKIALAGGMELDADGWLLDTYPDSWYLIFRDRDGALAHLFTNDCAPGSELFEADVRARLGA